MLAEEHKQKMVESDEKLKLVDYISKQINSAKKEISYLQLSELLVKIAKILESVPYSAIRKIDYIENEAIEKLAAKVAKNHELLKDMLEVHAEQEEELYTILDKQFNRTSDIWKNHLKRMEEFKNYKPVHIPYEVDRVVDLAEKWSHLPEEAWQRVIELAKSLKDTT